MPIRCVDNHHRNRMNSTLRVRNARTVIYMETEFLSNVRIDGKIRSVV